MRISVSLLCRKGTMASDLLTSLVSDRWLSDVPRLCATRFWLARITSMHWPRTINDLLILPASLSRSPLVWVFLLLSEPAKSIRVRREVMYEEGSWTNVGLGEEIGRYDSHPFRRDAS